MAPAPQCQQEMNFHHHPSAMRRLKALTASQHSTFAGVVSAQPSEEMKLYTTPNWGPVCKT